ncbi:histidine kinase [Labilibaculum sp. DW002]|uniref:Histidine kinase n=1 Tax=Paralabilibaculum antarcticum TaxID=2912572 RepID=A0ABT5VW64_9BACT|nr:histidine kinase [Labilibaculum sp. DW002]MDE5419645.1 histidine kinase [Labilibaculum sp. DW002]
MNIYKNKLEKWLPHIIGLLLFLILPIFVFDRDNSRAIFWINSYYYQLSFMIIAFYVNYLTITPRFFFRKRKVSFFIVIVLFAILLLYASQYLYNLLESDYLRPERLNESGRILKEKRFGMHPKLVDNFFLMIVVLGFSTGMANLQRSKSIQEEQKEIEKERLNTELAFLKNQISPHFFFNSLNNIYALIAIDGDKAQKAVEKLSGLMRYLIYDSDIKTVELKKEFVFMQNYIDLMQQRLTSKVKLLVNIQDDVPSVEIPPLIFITFVENAFKHGISYRSESFVSISLKTEGDMLLFTCENSIADKANKAVSEKGGLGIVNIKRRLNLLYGDKAQLIQSDKEGVYSIHLKVPLNYTYE